MIAQCSTLCGCSLSICKLQTTFHGVTTFRNNNIKTEKQSCAPQYHAKPPQICFMGYNGMVLDIHSLISWKTEKNDIQSPWPPLAILSQRTVCVQPPCGLGSVKFCWAYLYLWVSFETGWNLQKMRSCCHRDTLQQTAEANHIHL